MLVVRAKKRQIQILCSLGSSCLGLRGLLGPWFFLPLCQMEHLGVAMSFWSQAGLSDERAKTPNAPPGWGGAGA